MDKTIKLTEKCYEKPDDLIEEINSHIISLSELPDIESKRKEVDDQRKCVTDEIKNLKKAKD